MSTATTPLWPKPIPIIGGTGDKGHGKTRFGLSICPGPQTLVYDLEQSSASYDYIGFERIDVQKEMHAKYPKGYKPLQLFTWWLEHVRSIPAGKYRVIMVDPVTDLERGLADWVEANPAAFGRTAGQYASMSGVKWGDVKDYEKQVLVEITARCETFYFTAHIGTEFKGGKATDQKKTKGKETLFELASLYLWFERIADKKTGQVPNIPAARVIKSRLEHGVVKDGEVLSFAILPPRLPQATPAAIRKYFAQPAGGLTLKPEEVAREEVLSEDDKLRLRAQIAADEAIAAQARGVVAMPTESAPSPQPTPTPAVEPVSPPPVSAPVTAAPTSPPPPLAEGEPVAGRAPASATHFENFKADIAASADVKSLKVVGEAIGKAKREGWITQEHRDALTPIYSARHKLLKEGGAAAGSKS